MTLAIKNENLSCWVITEGMIGTENQCLGVAEALGVNPIIIQIKLKQPWKILTPWLGFEKHSTFLPDLSPPWPDLLITAGRKAVAASRYIKKQSKGKTFTVHLQDPKCRAKKFDLVAVPYHDNLRGKNVIVTDGAPNRITPTTLEQAKKDFSPFGKLPSPRVSVLIGGNSRTHKLTRDNTLDLVKKLQGLTASLMITTSRRTGEQNTKILQDGLKDDNIYFWDGKTNNPYKGMLAWADYILVTADSVSMISDACSTGKPVYLISMEGGSKRFNKLHNHLKKIGAIRDFEGNLESFSYEPLKDAEKISMEIENRLGIK